MTFIFYLTLILFVCVLFQGHEEALTWSPENPDTDAFGLQNQRGIVSCICGLSACAGKTARSACDNEL